MVAWTSRWHSNPNVEEVISKDKALEADWNEASLTQLVFFTMVPYLAWAVAYYAKVSLPSCTETTRKSLKMLTQPESAVKWI